MQEIVEMSGIDDRYYAAVVVGRGLQFTDETPVETIAAVREGLAQIAAETGRPVGLVLSAVCARGVPFTVNGAVGLVVAAVCDASGQPTRVPLSMEALRAYTLADVPAQVWALLEAQGVAVVAADEGLLLTVGGWSLGQVLAVSGGGAADEGEELCQAHSENDEAFTPISEEDLSAWEGKALALSVQYC